MNDCVLNWNMDDNYRPFHTTLPTSNRRKPLRPGNENELVELVWQNGNVVMHRRTNREPHGSINENHKHQILPKNGVSPENQHNLAQEDETASWFQFPLDDSLIKDFCSDLFCGTPIPESITADKTGTDAMGGDGFEKFELVQDKNVFVNPMSGQSNRLHNEDKTMPLPNLQNSKTDGLLGLSRTKEVNAGLPFQREVGESSSMVSKLSGNWDSTRVLKRPDLRPSSNDASDALAKQAEDIRKKFRESGQTETHETTTVASSSGASGSSFGRTDQQTDGSQSHKRKGRDVDESGSQSEEAEHQSIQGGRRLQRPASARRSRAAEVHNLSERRRRDRINEKMKALQGLIPHCNKTDKASMLDEAIEYLKSLQLQVQILWMGSGMAPMLFPNAQQYISLMGRGMGQGSMPTIPCSVQMPKISLPNQPMTLAPPTNQIPAVTSPNLNMGNFPTQVQNSNIRDAYARFLGFNQMQPPSQVMDLFSTHRNQGSQPNQATTSLTGSGEPATSGTAPLENTHGSK